VGYLDFYQLAEAEKREIFGSAGYATGLPSFAVEKDWWVVRALEIIYQTEIAENLVFKGGTSLSKAWGLIYRFSEDIDLALDRSFLGFPQEINSRNQVNRLRRESHSYITDSFHPQLISEFEEAGLPDVTINLIDVQFPDQDPLILEIQYPSVTEQSDYVQPRVLIEIGSRSQREPFTMKTIQSEVGLEYNDREFVDEPISIPTVNPERTYLEKLFLLHEEFQRPHDRIRVDRLSRHLYDIYQISKTDYAQKALVNLELYKSIVAHRSIFNRMGGVDYDSHFPPNLDPIPPDEFLKDWEGDYRTMQEQMIYGDSPSFEELIMELARIVSEINRLEFP